jgi:formylglycine-generating enzyme required for sulfatase activity
VYRGRDRRIAQDWRKFPVTGISADDAAAYAAWLAQTGRLPGARLCSEVEWERAARGADDRAYPGGGTPELDDINVDDTYGQALRGPDEVGSHPASNSPFGLEDMSGNALECTVGEDGGFILRGGGYWYDRKSAQVTNRAPFDRIVREASLGLRLCATPTPALPE